MTPRQRVRAALDHEQPDFTPYDYFATPEIEQGLRDHFGITGPWESQAALGGSSGMSLDNAVQAHLETDIRYIVPPYVGPPLPRFADSSTMNIWGVRRRPMPNQYGAYAEPVGTPYDWETVKEAERFAWPNPDWFDYEAVPASFDRLFAEKKRELFDMVHRYGARVTHHCCGSSRALIPRFIACGMDALQTIQPQAAGMNPYELKAEFGGQIALHGAVDVQGWLQRATPAEIEQEVHRLIDEVGTGGGFILAPCHQLQPDTPLENILALYPAVAKRRGRQIAGV